MSCICTFQKGQKTIAAAAGSRDEEHFAARWRSGQAAVRPVGPIHAPISRNLVFRVRCSRAKYGGAGKAGEFVCAAGTLTHYIGDACQPDGAGIAQVRNQPIETTAWLGM
jgi:hypothetical protein